MTTSAKRKKELTESAIDYAISFGEDHWNMSGGDSEALAQVAIEATLNCLGRKNEDEEDFDREAIETAIEVEFA